MGLCTLPIVSTSPDPSSHELLQGKLGCRSGAARAVVAALLGLVSRLRRQKLSLWAKHPITRAYGVGGGHLPKQCYVDSATALPSAVSRCRLGHPVGPRPDMVSYVNTESPSPWRDALFSIGRLAAAAATVLTVLPGLEWLGIRLQDIGVTNLKALIVVLLILLGWLITESLVRVLPRRPPKKSNQPFEQHLIEEVRRLLKDEQYASVIRYRNAFSRSLWVEGKHAARIALGEAAEEAALRSGDFEAQSAALVDDMGWTSVAAKRLTEAQTHLEHGREVAAAHGLTYWEAKAWRHLGGLGLEKRDYKTAYSNLEQAKEVARRIPDSAQRTEMLAGIEYGLATAAYNGHDIENAEVHLLASREMRAQLMDPLRAVRIHAMLGKIYEAQRKTSQAFDNFRVGLSESRKLGRVDEQVRNLLGLARLETDRGRSSAASEYREEANRLSGGLALPLEADEVEMKHWRSRMELSDGGSSG